MAAVVDGAVCCPGGAGGMTPIRGAIDIVVNPRVIPSGQVPVDTACQVPTRQDARTKRDVEIDDYLAVIDAAGIERSLLFAVRCRATFRPERPSGVARRSWRCAALGSGPVGAHLLTAWHILRDNALLSPWHDRRRARRRLTAANIEPPVLMRRLIEATKQPRYFQAAASLRRAS